MSFAYVIYFLAWIYVGMYVSSFFSYDYEMSEHKDPSSVLLVFMIIFWPVFAIILYIKSISNKY